MFARQSDSNRVEGHLQFDCALILSIALIEKIIQPRTALPATNIADGK